MAVSTINPWAAGAVVLDQRPFLQFYERQMAREQAKNDALENYFKGLDKNITSAGMRSQDVPTLLQKNRDWQEHYMQNKAAILNPKLDNGAAYNKYMSGYQDQMALTNESKQAYKNKEELGKMKFNKDFSYVFDDPDIINKIASDDLPIGHPQRQPFDMTTATLPPKLIGTKEKEEFSKYILGDVKPDKIPGTPLNIGNFQTQTPITHQYSEQNKKIFGDRAADVYDTDRNWRANAVQTFKEVQHNPVLHDQLNAIHKRYYGTDVDNPRDAFVAKTILDHDIRTMEYQKGEDIFGREKAMEAIRFGHQKQLKKGEQEAADNWIDNYWKTRISDAKLGQPKSLSDPDSPLTIKMGYEIKPDAVMMKGLARNNVEPDAVFVTSDNKIMPVFYKYKELFDDKTGKKIGTTIDTDANGNIQYDSDLSKPMDLDQAYLSLGYRGQTKKELGGTMTGAYQGQKETKTPSTRKYDIDGKTYTHDQLRKLYSEEKIKEYLDAGIIK